MFMPSIIINSILQGNNLHTICVMKSNNKNSLLLITVFSVVGFMLYQNSKLKVRLFSTYCAAKNFNQQLQSKIQSKQNNKNSMNYIDCISCINYQDSESIQSVGSIWIQQAFQTDMKQKKQIAVINALQIQQSQCFQYECPQFHFLQDFQYKNIQSKTLLKKYGFKKQVQIVQFSPVQCFSNSANEACWKAKQKISNIGSSGLIIRHRMAYKNKTNSILQIPKVLFKYTTYNSLDIMVLVLIWFMILFSFNHRKVTKNLNSDQKYIFTYGVSLLIVALLIPYSQQYITAIFIGLFIHLLPLIFYDIKCLGWFWILISLFGILISGTIFIQIFQKITCFLFIVLLLLYSGFSKLLLRDRIGIWLISLQLVVALFVVTLHPELYNHISSLVPIYSFCGAICAENCQLKAKQIQVKPKQQVSQNQHELQDRIERQLSQEEAASLMI